MGKLHTEFHLTTHYKGSKNISIRMLKDVGMTVPKSRETSVYICSNTGNERLFICSKTEDEGSILYAPRQGMRACNNNNMRKPIMKDVGRDYACYYILFNAL